jgi:LytS/YehU family sensor histidine kinase
MTSIIAKTKNWYADLEARKLATLPADLREEVLAFDVSVRRHKWRLLGASIALWCGAAAAFRYGVSDAGWIEGLVLSFVVLVSLAFAILSVWFGHYKIRFGASAVVRVLGLAVAGALMGGAIGRLVRHGTLTGMFDGFGSVGSRVFVAGLVVGVVYGLLILAVVQMRRRLLQARHAALVRQAEADRTARQLADARLKLMQAQVEPHFLFNTLASVQELAEGKAPEAAALTRELITFLRAGLAGLRDDTTTLAREFDMAAAFLAIMKTRMGERLTFELNLPGELADESMPPAMLISLVENAIKHGLEPALDGGHLGLSARRDGSMLTIEVRDTGLGLGVASAAASGGVGLSNIRERLAAIYGADASLSVHENQPRGVVAAITLIRPLPGGPTDCRVMEH